MVESSGGSSCRCACQDDFQDAQEQPTGCCSPHVFTSILLGILSCVLMTGGVFLAFHRWDPMWLTVSGVGVVLIIIGTILHCCNNLSQRPKRHSAAGKGCCARPIPPEHAGHVMTNNGSLTEQLLPLSNARSVSQLSLNMLPGYFPPVVTAYGIEQHSAVVQNINRLVQQQQQQQQPQSPGAVNPGSTSNAGKSFIVLSLPGDANSTNIQNLVATVYQLDGNTTEPTGNETVSNTSPNVIGVKPNSPFTLILKNAEVQTCNAWPVPTASTSGQTSSSSQSSAMDERILQASVSQPIVSSASCGSTQTDDISPVSEIPNLLDYSTSPTPICDSSSNARDNQTTENSASVNIPPSSSADLLDVSLTNDVLVDIPELPVENGPPNTTDHQQVDVTVNPPSNLPADCPEVLVDISEITSSNDTTPLLNNLSNDNLQDVEVAPPESVSVALPSTSENLIELPCGDTNSNLHNLSPELVSSNSNLSAVDTEIDDGELMERSSPPPSYDDVALEGDNSVGAFGLAYGTI